MSDGPTHSYPPPGAPPPEESAAGSAYPAPGAAAPPYQVPPPGYPEHGRPPVGEMLGAAHKPGAIPLRPLNLGAIYDGAFRIIRFNPKATVGAAVLVAAVANLIPVIVTAVLTFTLNIPFEAVMAEDPEAMDDVGTGEVIGLVVMLLALLGGAVATWFGLVFVTGMVAHVAHAAATGRRLTLRQAWDATHGKRWRLIGLSLVISTATLALIVFYILAWTALAVTVGDVLVLVLFGLVSGPLFIGAMFWFWIKVYYLPVPALMLEDVGVFGAIGRGYRLTAQQFWRIFGIALLTQLIAAVAGQMLSTPIAWAGQLLAIALPDLGWLLLVGSNSLGTVLVNAFVAPFTAAVASLQYIDQRMRKEAYDVELMREAGLMQR